MTNEEVSQGLTKVQEILSALRHNFIFRPSHVKWYGKEQMAEIKSILSAVELLISSPSDSEPQPQLDKGCVSGWQEFEKQMPNAGDEVIVIDPVTNEKSIIKYRVLPKDREFWKGWRWHPLPVCH